MMSRNTFPEPQPDSALYHVYVDVDVFFGANLLLWISLLWFSNVPIWSKL